MGRFLKTQNPQKMIKTEAEKRSLRLKNKKNEEIPLQEREIVSVVDPNPDPQHWPSAGGLFVWIRIRTSGDLIRNLGPHLRTSNPELNPGFSPRSCYIKGGVGCDTRVKPAVWRPEIWDMVYRNYYVKHVYNVY
jgi:hypothetical protein